jgi:hypothetical protein
MKECPTEIVPKILTHLNERIIWPVTSTVTAKREYRAARAKHKGATPTIVCYPEKPKVFHSLYKIAHRAGYKITNTLDAHAACIIRFEDTTHGTPFPALEELARTRPVINIRCTDISKQHVEEVFEEVFGYGMKIDPRTYVGECVQKSDMNALHDGAVVTCPLEPKAGYIYQRLIRNEVDPNTVEDLRLLIIQNTIPYVTKRYKHISDRFDATIDATLAETHEVLSPEEITHVLTFCTRMGLDYGELDALRDRTDGKLYLIDVNNTPASPGNPMLRTLEKKYAWFSRMSQAFTDAFFDGAQ